MGVQAIESRTRERLFGVSGLGRSSRLCAGIKIAKLGDDYDPREDTCVRAFVRLLATTTEGAAGEA